MAEFPYFRSSLARKVEPNQPEARSGQEATNFCAYNQTRQRFLCANVEVADSSTSLDARLPSLTPTSGAALWIVPIQAISPTSVRVPLDLVYLDRNSVVLDAVESFPISQPTASSAAATSILALPSQTIASTGTQPGDRLILCAPEEMKQRLQKLPEAKPDPTAQKTAVSSQNPAQVNDQLASKAAGNVLQFVDRSNPKPPSENLPPEIPTVDPAPTQPAPIGASTAPAPAVTAAPAIPAPPIASPALAAPPQAEDAPQPKEQPAPRWKVAPSKNWLQRLLASEPADPRKAQREVLTGLVAYFFTGGRPVAHQVRDISVTGLYVLTEERWYPGTVVRITLTDRRDPTSERSFTINAKVVRAADDGVGFQFLLKDGKDSLASQVDRQAVGVLRAEVEEFLGRFKSSAN